MLINHWLEKRTRSNKIQFIAEDVENFEIVGARLMWIRTLTKFVGSLCSFGTKLIFIMSASDCRLFF